jgi:hypothetical protein
MALDPVVNFFRSQIATLPVASGGTVIVLPTGDGNKLPNPATDGAFNLTIYNADDPFVTPEIVRVTGRSGDTLTVTRAQEGTTATNKTAGSTWSVELTPTAKTIQDIDSKKVEKTGDTMTGTLTATKLIPSGNVTAGNGMYLPAANTVAVSTNGVEAFRVDSSQRLGIGTTAPTELIEARQSSVGGDTSILIVNTATTGTTAETVELKFALANNTDRIAKIVAKREGTFASAGTANSSLRFFNSLSGTPTEQMTILANGNVGIGTTNPSRNISVSAVNPQMVLKSTTTTGFSEIYFGDSDSDLAGYIGYGHTNNRMDVGTNGTTKLSITSAGNVGIGTTAPATKLDVVGSIRSSVGILFGTDTASANTLDDYEEGTWSPVWSFATSGSVTQSTGAGTYGRYTKIGDIVCITFRTFTTALSSPTGKAVITNLPFTVANNDTAATVGSIFRWGTNFTNLMANIVGTTVEFHYQASNISTETALEGSDFSVGTNFNVIEVSGFYRT